MAGQLMKKLRATVYRAHKNESGAVALLCLAAVLALMMVTWTIVDAGKAVEDKVMLQGAADTAALSHASVEARSMNMIAYANIAKRSIVGIHSMYPGMFFAYTVWMIDQATGCTPIPVPPWVKNPVKCGRFVSNAPQWIKEALGDHAKYSGNAFMPYAGGVIQTVADILSWIDKIPFVNLGLGGKLQDSGQSLVSGYSRTAYARDLKALDNYQRYMQHLTPWWSWSEQLIRGWRNGATSVSSFPPPPGKITVGLQIVDQAIGAANDVLSDFGLKTIDFNGYYGNDGLPIKKKSYGWTNWLCHMFLGRDDCGISEAKAILTGTGDFGAIGTMGNESFVLEHLLNAAVHKKNSKKGAKKWIVVAGGATVGYALFGIQYSRLAFGDLADPFVIDRGGSDGEWLKRTSNLTFAYLRDPKRMDQDRSKFNVPASSYKNTIVPQEIADRLYKPSGYWTMSKSEITFNGPEGLINSAWKPDLWHPSWTARMRPVHLPGEFAAGQYTMFDAYMQTLPYLALSAQVGSIDGGGGFVDAVVGSVADMAVMAASAAAMGDSTSAGVAK